MTIRSHFKAEYRVEQKYPYLGIADKNTDEVVIVFFRKKGAGTVVYAGGQSPWTIGLHHDTWAEDQFEPFYGKVVLES